MLLIALAIAGTARRARRASGADSDGDTIAECVDRCPGDDDRVDADHNSIPDCLETAAVPTASA